MASTVGDLLKIAATSTKASNCFEACCMLGSLGESLLASDASPKPYPVTLLARKPQRSLIILRLVTPVPRECLVHGG
jgi:hypothetical protein